MMAFDNMGSFNDYIKHISIREFLIVLILLYIIWYLTNSFIKIPADTVYIFIIIYFIFKLRNHSDLLKKEISTAFSRISFKNILFIVILNIFFSYGMLYLSNYLIVNFDGIGQLFYPAKSFAFIFTFLGIVVISPICEELIFRGMILNKLQIIVPKVFALIISSLLFASLHSFGSIFSAFIFALCMGVLYMKTDNIIVPILAHFLNNIIAEVIVHIDSGSVLFNNESVIFAVSVLAVVSFVLILWSLFSELKKH